MKKIILLTIISLLVLINSSFAFNSEDFNYLHLKLDDESSTNKVSFELLKPQETEYIFEMNILYNNEKQDESCKNNIQIESGIVAKKITCEIPKLGDGEYTFEGYLYDNEKNLLKRTINKEFIFADSNTVMNFNVKENKTIITIVINSDKPITVINEIPKEVIASLTKENKDILLKSNIEYTILEEDPLIAWNIEEPPAKINYTINKKISIEDQKNFQLEVKNDSTFKGLKYIIFVIILIIIGLLIKPALVKKK